MGICVHGLSSADRIGKTCCALHYMLLEVGGLDEAWTDGISSYWEGEAGMISDSCDSTFAINRLCNPSCDCSFDSSGMGQGIDRD